jgi:hypothetical protein
MGQQPFEILLQAQVRIVVFKRRDRKPITGEFAAKFQVDPS